MVWSHREVAFFTLDMSHAFMTLHCSDPPSYVLSAVFSCSSSGRSFLFLGLSMLYWATRTSFWMLHYLEVVFLRFKKCSKFLATFLPTICLLFYSYEYLILVCLLPKLSGMYWGENTLWILPLKTFHLWGFWALYKELLIRQSPYA